VESWSLATIAALLVVFAALSRRLDRTVVTPAIFFVSAGLVAGNEALGWIDLEIESSDVRLLAEVTLTLVLFADASRINVRKLRREYTVPLRLLGIGLPLTIALGAALAFGVITSLSFAEALILAIVLAPTDAALGEAVVSDRRLPSRIRQGLNVESGLNDGICVPLLFIAIAWTEAEEGALDEGAAVRIVAEEIGFGLLGGAVAGAVGAVLVTIARRRGLAASSWLQVLPAATAALCYGLADPLGGSGFIAAFVGGFVYGVLAHRLAAETTRLVDEVGELLNAVTFLVFAAAIVGPVLADLTWAVAAYAVLSLTVVRMIPVAVAFMGTKARPPTVGYAGWFGPRGLASVVFAVIIVEQAALANTSTILTAITATIVLSVYAHGISAKPLTDRYVRWYETRPEGLPPMESIPVPEHRQRWARE
jgi:NhaP-type Na+/H+ or K+/H+ antiporter